jgi:hypothetical protein
MTSLREHSGPSIESVIREKQTVGTREIAVVGAAASGECWTCHRKPRNALADEAG